MINVLIDVSIGYVALVVLFVFASWVMSTSRRQKFFDFASILLMSAAFALLVGRIIREVLK